MGYPSQYLQIGALQNLKGLEIKARLIVEGFLSGLHRSPYQGFSVEFSEHRPYFPGDALKNVDWKVFARSEKLFVKKLAQIIRNPEIGKDLGNKNSLNLVGLKKVYFDNKRYRIVYQVLENEIIIYIIAIGKRDNMEVYKEASLRYKENTKKGT